LLKMYSEVGDKKFGFGTFLFDYAAEAAEGRENGGNPQAAEPGLSIMTAFTFRMPSGIPGDVNRAHHATNALMNVLINGKLMWVQADAIHGRAGAATGRTALHRVPSCASRRVTAGRCR
jgi:hypothetical protein